MPSHGAWLSAGNQFAAGWTCRGSVSCKPHGGWQRRHIPPWLSPVLSVWSLRVQNPQEDLIWPHPGLWSERCPSQSSGWGSGSKNRDARKHGEGGEMGMKLPGAVLQRSGVGRSCLEAATPLHQPGPRGQRVIRFPRLALGPYQLGGCGAGNEVRLRQPCPRFPKATASPEARDGPAGLPGCSSLVWAEITDFGAPSPSLAGWSSPFLQHPAVLPVEVNYFAVVLGTDRRGQRAGG